MSCLTFFAGYTILSISRVSSVASLPFPKVLSKTRVSILAHRLRAGPAMMNQRVHRRAVVLAAPAQRLARRHAERYHTAIGLALQARKPVKPLS